MVYEEVEKIVGPAAAAKLCDDDYINSLPEGDFIDVRELDGLLRGAVIVGVEPVEYPEPEGLVFYVKLPTGDIMELNSVIHNVNSGPYYCDSLYTTKRPIHEAGEDLLLTRCPICGAQGRIMREEIDGECITWIECEQCGERTRTYKAETVPDAVERAAIEWNYREYVI